MARRLLFEDLRIHVGEKAADGGGADDQDRDADEAVRVHEVAAQGLVRNLFLIAIPHEDVLTHLDEESAAGADEVQRRSGIQGTPGHIVGDVGDLAVREELSRLGAGGSPLPVVEPHGLHECH